MHNQINMTGPRLGSKHSSKQLIFCMGVLTLYAIYVSEIRDQFRSLIQTLRIPLTSTFLKN